MDSKEQAHNTTVKKLDHISPTVVRLTAELPEDVVRAHKSATIQRFCKSAKVPGFRPGKVPLKLIQDRFGQEIRKEVLSHLVEMGVYEAILNSKLNPLNAPHIQLKDASLEDGKALQFEVEFEFQPEVEVSKYKEIPISKADLSVNDEEVHKAIEIMRDSRAVLEPIESTKAEKGNYAVVQIGFEIKSNPPKKDEKRTYTFEVGSSQLIPALDAALLDMSVNEERTVVSSISDKDQDEKIRGKEVVYQVKLLELKKKRLPDLDDSFAAIIREDLTVDKLKTEVRQNIENSKKKESMRDIRNQIVEYLIEQNKFEVSKSLVDKQMKELLDELQNKYKKEGHNPSQISNDEIAFLRQHAERMVRSSLLLSKIAIKEKIDANEAELETRIKEISDKMNRSVGETHKWLSGTGLLGDVKMEIIMEKVYEFLISNSKVQAEPQES